MARGDSAGLLISCIRAFVNRVWEALVLNPQTTPGHCLLRYVIPTRDLRSPNGAKENSQGREPLVIE